FQIASAERVVRSMRSSCFYYDISGEEAEKVLLKYGVKGDFLARPSESQPTNYTLSINRGGTITHVKVQRKEDDTLDLLGGENFTSLSDLIQHYIDNPELLKERNGDTIYMIRPVVLPPEEVKKRRVKAAERWFHTGVNGAEAAQLLAKEKQWSFLVRESQRSPGQMAISVKVGDDTYKHIMLEKNALTGKVHVGGGDEFNTINDLLAHYRKNPLVEEVTQNVVRLTNMLPSTSVPVEAFNERMAVLSRKDESIGGLDGFSHEFTRLNEMDDSMYSRRDGKLPNNVDKNRYKNIVPYDHTRVKLKDTPSKSDYINANYIQMVTKKRDGLKSFDRRYISTQGCLSNTVGDFWRMVFQQEVVVIVMTTKECERGRVKCERYWPEKGKMMSADGGEYCIKNMDEKSYHEGEEYSFIRRTLILKRKDGEGRSVTQFQFLGWPDHGCPESAEAVLSLLKMADDEAVKHPEAPVVVHCSAGIGRTGTFIVLDLILHEIMLNDGDCDIDVARTLMEIREQRQGMVQTEPQYKFIYKALAHYINTSILNGDQSINSSFLAGHQLPTETSL
ncbi:ptp-2, partial [Pristionchus pacificus]